MGLGLVGTQSFLSSVPPSSGAFAWRTALSTSVQPPCPRSVTALQLWWAARRGTPALQCLFVGPPPSGMGKCLAGWRCAGPCAVTHLAAPTTALDEGP